MESLSMESIQCRKPSKSYDLFLKAKWMQFQINTLVQHGSFPLQGYRKFIEFHKKVSTEERENLAEFYIHNLILTYLNFWDQKSRLGDMQLMALASWFTH